MKRLVDALSGEYGMLVVLLALCAVFSVLTLERQQADGADGGAQLARELSGDLAPGASVLVVARPTAGDTAFVDALRTGLEERGLAVREVVRGTPRDARQALERLAAADAGAEVDAIACPAAVAAWPVFAAVTEPVGVLPDPRSPRARLWPDFLKADNLRNIAAQISVIAIVAIGMTMVIITAGIDLSVGSLIALSAVVATWIIRELAGAEAAGVAGMTAGALGAIVACGLAGAFTGTMVTALCVPPFIVTLAMMLMMRGLAFKIAGGESIYQVPEGFTWLGRGTVILGLPNAVVLMGALYLAAHFVMSHTRLGRYVYAVGGNPEAARLSGVPVKRVKLLAYTVCGALAGLGGVVLGSQLRSGAGTYGQMYELYVIAAVVVGGTSLFGGRGRMFGTLIGALIIAVIQNGMNLEGLDSYTQMIVLGFVILAAVVLERLKSGAWRSTTGG